MKLFKKILCNFFVLVVLALILGLLTRQWLKGALFMALIFATSSLILYIKEKKS